jgi:hypothetical protein
MPEIPITTVLKTMGPINILISPTNISPTGLSCTAQSGRTTPSPMPSVIATST